MKNGETISNKQANELIDWFESHYTPGELKENGKPSGAEIVVKGIKGNIVIRMVYFDDLYGKSA